MKKILFILLLFSLKSFGQYPVNQTLGSDSTLVTSKGAFKSRLINIVFTDTTAANLQRIKFYNSAQIVTTSGGIKFWLRDSINMAWVRIGGGSGSGISEVLAGYGLIQVNDSTLKVDTTLIATILQVQHRIDSLGALKLNISDTTNKWVNNVWRVPGIDSIFFQIGSTVYKIKDSIGGGGGMTIPGSSTEFQYRVNATTLGASPVMFHQTNQVKIAANGSTVPLLVEGHEDISLGAVLKVKSGNDDTLFTVNQDSTIMMPNKASFSTSPTNFGKYYFKGNKPYATINSVNYDLTANNINAFVNGGNSFGALAQLGTNDSNHLNFRTNNQIRGRISADGNFIFGGTADDGHKLRVTGGVRFDLGSDDTLDMYYRDADGSLTRLPAPAGGGKHLVFNGSAYQWLDTAQGFSADFAELKFTTDSTELGPAGGDSIIVVPGGLTNRKVDFWRSGSLQMDSTYANYENSGYEIRGDTIVTHPPLLNGEQVIIHLSKASDWTYLAFPGYDADAAAYFAASGITDRDQKVAYNDFVLELKAAGIWSYFDFLHLLMGGDATKTKFNLVDPVDADANYRLTFPNSATFASTGITTASGSSQYINTHYIMTGGTGGQNDYHIAVYNRTSAGVAGFTFGVASGTPTIYGLCRSTDDKSYFKSVNSGEQNFTDATSGKGFYILNKKSTAPNITVYKDGVQKLATADNGAAQGLPDTYPLTFNAYNNVGTISQYRSGELCIISGGKSFNDTQRAAYETAVANLVAALGL